MDFKETAPDWFEQLRTSICDTFEAIEDEHTGPFSDRPAGRFERTAWERPEGGGGVMAVMKGRVFEKVGVNVSTVWGEFSDKFRGEVPGTSDDDGGFWASGVSLVAHMHSPLVPAVHMNTRHIVTANKAWFGGGGDLNPPLPDDTDTSHFHGAFRDCCERHTCGDYPRFKEWADDYFFIKHRNMARGVGGIFYDYIDADEASYAFTRDVGETFKTIYPALIRRHMARQWTPDQREEQLIYRGRYAEFNLVYDRGTRFGLMTGGNTDAILMSLPPEAKWP
ncbi:MAG: oxygen-dependent coproporphyrinogen oxidase [Alphaproteobacteria bacterium]|jgi:coproporphyrinogen III oxidase